MSIKIEGLTAQSGEQRQLRELINTPQGAIEIYEPTTEDISKIIDFQHNRDSAGGEDTGIVSFDGVEVIKGLFPLVTNIDLGELSDGELKAIIENPTVHLLIAQQMVAQLVSEANKLYVEQIKTELMESDSTMAQVELMNAIPAMIMEKAKGQGRVGELVQKVEKAGKELEDAIAREEQSSQKPELKLVEPTDEQKI